MTLPNGTQFTLQILRGALVEFTAVKPPLTLFFEFNPATMTRSRTVTVRTGGTPGTRGGYDFEDVTQIPRASQGVTVEAETFTVKILLDATDRMNAGDPLASIEGIQPDLDTIRSMLEPKTQTPDGARTLAALGQGSERAFSRHQFASVLLFVWGVHILPVYMTQAQMEIKEYLPTLLPYRAEATLTLQVIESVNPFYLKEVERQFRSATLNVGALLNLATKL